LRCKRIVVESISQATLGCYVVIIIWLSLIKLKLCKYIQSYIHKIKQVLISIFDKIKFFINIIKTLNQVQKLLIISIKKTDYILLFTKVP